MELYLHIPFCIKKCNYCDFLSGPYEIGVRHDYTDALCRELLSYGDAFSGETFSSVYIGGGTPSLLEVAYMQRIVNTVRDVFSIEKDAEITMECNPGTTGQEELSFYRELGINRLSIGLQSVHPSELENLGRIHTAENFYRTFEAARKAGFDNINVDIMNGLPHQTKKLLQETITEVTRLKPEHISCYSLMIEEKTPFYDRYHEDVIKREKDLDTEALPDADEEYALYKESDRLIQEAGYHRYEFSNYATEGKECRHNIGYWKRTPYLGAGIGAASLIGEVRYANERDIFSYMEKVKNHDSVRVEETPVRKKDAMAEYMYLGLRMTDGISREEFFKAFHITVEAVYGKAIKKLEEKKLLKQYAGRVFLTERGMDVSNVALAEFLPD